MEVVEGIAEAIDHARSLGWRVGVFTGKGRRSAEFTLAELGLWDRIEHLVSSDDVTRPKPDPEGVFRASEALGVPVDRILLAGDSPADVTAGRAAGRGPPPSSGRRTCPCDCGRRGPTMSASGWKNWWR